MHIFSIFFKRLCIVVFVIVFPVSNALHAALPQLVLAKARPVRIMRQEVLVSLDKHSHLLKNVPEKDSYAGEGATAAATFLEREVSLGSALQAASLSLHHRIQELASRTEPGVTHEFLKTLRLCAPCTKYQRVGEDHDGGYVMCADGLDKSLAGAYSFGINGFDGWGMSIASQFQIPLNEFDCTNSQQPKVCKGCEVHFHNQCILNNNGDAKAAAEGLRLKLRGVTTSELTADSFKTLSQTFKEGGNAKAKDRSLLLKIDVESAEWKIFAEEPVEHLKKFREIVVEYHWIHQVANHALYLKAVKQIERAGFAVTHMHGNNYGRPMQHFGMFSIPDDIEVTYIQMPKAGCATNIPYKVSGLDMRNSKNPAWAEMPDAVLPASF